MSESNCCRGGVAAASASETDAAPQAKAVKKIKLSDPLRAALENTTASAKVRAQATSARVRKNIRKLSPLEVNILRNAFEGLYAISNPNDTRGYEWIAGRHGYPGNYCHLSPPDFYTWHRAYVYEFEERLRDAQQRATGVATVTLPYWDWTVIDKTTDDQYGIPKVCSDPSYTDLQTGVVKPNPLYSAYSIATGKNTTRNPVQLPLFVNQRKQQVDDALNDPDYISAESKINTGPHGNVHLKTGGGTGDMTTVRNAAFDPIFWLHHAQVDRIFWLWQRRHGNSTVPQARLDYVAAPWSYTGKQILDAAGFFHYTYREDELFRPFAAVQRAGLAAVAKQSAPAVSVELGELSPGFDHARMRLHNTQRTEGSYEVRVFFNQPDASDKTATDDNPSYGGSFYLFGHGTCIGDEGHCDVVARREGDQRPPHHYTPQNLTFDVTDAVKTLAKSRKKRGDVSVSFVVLDAAGEPAAPDEFAFEGVSLETY
ncbi:MAG TPA: tyrosinase family protein [Longimicrobium sp.]|jgi:tyrosinase|nr:tyrosinase family protein [Longimicrobium sp.]